MHVKHAEYTQRETSETPTIMPLSFHCVPNDPHSAPVINCPWTDFLRLSKHMMSNTWPHKHMTALLTLTEHCLTVLCILWNILKTKMCKKKNDFMLAIFTKTDCFSGKKYAQWEIQRQRCRQGQRLACIGRESHRWVQQKSRNRSYTQRSILFWQRQKTTRLHRIQIRLRVCISVHALYVYA